MAVLGQMQGPFGVLVADVGITGALVLYIGAGVFTHRPYLTVAVVVCLLAIGVFVSAAYGILSRRPIDAAPSASRSEEHTSELQSPI